MKGTVRPKSAYIAPHRRAKQLHVNRTIDHLSQTNLSSPKGTQKQEATSIGAGTTRCVSGHSTLSMKHKRPSISFLNQPIAEDEEVGAFVLDNTVVNKETAEEKQLRLQRRRQSHHVLAYENNHLTFTAG